MQSMPKFTDLISRGGAMYARNERGLHVPIEVLTVEHMWRAQVWVWGAILIKDPGKGEPIDARIHP